MASLALMNTAEAKDDDLAEVVESLEEIIAEFGVRATVAAMLRSSAGSSLNANDTLRAVQMLIREIACAKNAQLEAEIWAMASSMVLNDKMTVRSIAAKWGMSPAAISKRLVKLCDENGLPPSIYMRTKKDRATYALTNRPRRASK